MISKKFCSRRISLQSSHPGFPKIFVSPKMVAILKFRIFGTIAKHKNAYISKTVLDRAILTKFFTHRVSLRDSHPKFLCRQKWRPFCIFEFFVKIAKHKTACILKPMHDTAISMKLFALKFFTKLAKHKHACI